MANTNSEPKTYRKLGWEARIGLSVIGLLSMTLVVLVGLRVSQALRPAKPVLSPPRVAYVGEPRQALASSPSADASPLSTYHSPPSAAANRYAAGATDALNSSIGPPNGTRSNSYAAPTARAATDSSLPRRETSLPRYSPVLAAPPATIVAEALSVAETVNEWNEVPQHAPTETLTQISDKPTTTVPMAASPLPPPSVSNTLIEERQDDRRTVDSPMTPSFVERDSKRGRTALAPNTSYAARMYVVQPGDTLTSIAAQELGSRRRWLDIWQLNASRLGGNLSQLTTGISLILPAEATTIVRSPRKRSSGEHSPRERR